MRVFRHLTYANVIATLALFLALGGTAVAGTRLFITGADVQDHSLTGVDLKNGSVGASVLSQLAIRQLTGARGARGAAGKDGAAGAPGATGATGSAGPQGPAGTGITTTVVAGADQSNYADLTPIASYALPAAGDYVVFTRLTVANTGANGEYLNCGYRTNGTISGAAGFDTSAGESTSGTSAGVVNVDGPTTVDFVCMGNGQTSYDLSAVSMRIHFLG